jgi:phosphatidylglycerophosphate synthase
MSKLAAQDKFLDLSDYGRPAAAFLVQKIKNTRITAIHITLLFGICGLFAIYCIIIHQYYLASIFLILKSVIDAADGELARVKKTPSYVGRYLDSVFDIVLNFLIFFAIAYTTNTSYFLALLSFVCVQLQGTLYNYYYVILRNNSVGGDATSKIFENKAPKAFNGESQKAVNFLFFSYYTAYGVFDKIIYLLDVNAYKTYKFPNWFMTFVSIYGLGFQLLLIAIMLSFNIIEYILPFFVFYSVFVLLMIWIRKTFLDFR